VDVRTLTEDVGDMRRLVSVVLVLGACWLAGCGQEEAEQAQRYQAAVERGEDPDAELFHADVTLYRRYTGRKWMLDKDHAFRVKDESRIRAEVALANVRADRTYSVHLVWVKPDGDSAYHRYAEVKGQWVDLPPGAEPDSTGALPADVVETLGERWGEEAAERLATRLARDPEAAVWIAETTYKKAEDLGYVRRNISLEAARTLMISSVFNISREKERPLGDYRLQIFLDRRLLTEVPFIIEDLS